MKKKLLSIILLIALLVSFSVPARAQAAELKLNKAKVILEVDAKITLKLGDIAATDVKWSSSARKIASVTSKGVVTAKSEGDATITATYNKKKYTCKVTVVDSNKEEKVTPTPTPSKNTPTTGQKNALKSAKNYLETMPFSYKGLISQLEYEKYSHEDAVYAADNCGADWKEQAVKSAKNYLNVMSFSKDGLIDQLEFEGFTHEQAVYGAEKNGY